jgi:hypothetical protein
MATALFWRASAGPGASTTALDTTAQGVLG